MFEDKNAITGVLHGCEIQHGSNRRIRIGGLQYDLMDGINLTPSPIAFFAGAVFEKHKRALKTLFERIDGKRKVIELDELERLLNFISNILSF